MRSPRLHRRLAVLMIVVAAASLPIAYAHALKERERTEFEQLSRALAEYKAEYGQGWDCRGGSISPSAPLR